MPKIYFDGTNQYVNFSALETDVDGNIIGQLTGESEGVALPGAILGFSQYKVSDANIPTPSVTWNATIGRWKAVISHTSITQYGPAEINVSATNMVNVSIDVDVVPSDILSYAGIITAFNNNDVEAGYTFIEVIRGLSAVFLGKRVRNGNTETYTGLDGSTSRVVATITTNERDITTMDGD